MSPIRHPLHVPRTLSRPPRVRRTRAGLTIRRAAVALIGGVVAVAGAGEGLAAPVSASGAETTPLAPFASERWRTSPDLDVLFVGAHPDDEAGRLSTYGQWNEFRGMKTGVVTITRGEGGGNAVGPEEGPALGMIREAEERRAVSRAAITDVYNLDQLDFFYTVSAPLTEDVWGHDDTLDRVVRVIRETRPEIIVTMDPAPSPGNHGNHQYAGRMAFEAYNVAGDPSQFRHQIYREGLEPWAASKLLLSSARGTTTGVGRTCPTQFTPVRPSQNIYGVWDGRWSEKHGDSWAQIEREAQREYASQGWSVFPDVTTDRNQIGCDFFTQVESRVPFVRGDLSPQAAAPTTILQGALLRTPGGLPLGTGLDVSAEPFAVTPGSSTTVTIDVTAPKSQPLTWARVDVDLPSGWAVEGDQWIGTVKRGESVTETFTVTAPADAATNQRVLASVDLASRGRHGHNDTELEVVPVVRGTSELLPQVADFQQYAVANGYPQMEGFVTPVLTLTSGGSRDVEVTVTNFGDSTESGEVRLDVPAGFEAEPAMATYEELAAGDTTTVTFGVTNTDATLATSMQGGDYPYTIETTSSAGSSTTAAALELVPTTTIEEAAAAPTVDGVVDAGEYTGTPLDLSRLWEGTACESASDCSATGHLTRSGDDLYVAVEVTDDILGTVLDPSDCKRHWRTDSVEIALDPDGGSENTSTTFKSLVLPTTTSGEPCYGRDADNEQGPGAETAPDMEIASTVTEPYTGYVIEAKIPASELPSTVDPQHLGLNVFVYDSDTLDKTGQTRIGWSTWGGVQGDPYRWGVATLPGWTPPAVPTVQPTIPSEALSSLDSPQTIAQAVRNGVAVGGGPAADRRSTAVARWARDTGSVVRVSMRVRGPGEAHVFVVGPAGRVLGSTVERVTPRWRVQIAVPVDRAVPTWGRVLVAFAADSGGSTASAVRVR